MRIAILLSTLAYLVSCGGSTNMTRYVKVKRSSEEANPNKPDAEEQGEDIPLALIQSDYGVRNVLQINETMSVLTGVDPLTANVAAEYALVRTSLPSNNDIRSFLASQQSGITKLATEYCDAMVRDPALRVAVAPQFEWNAVSATALSADGQSELISSYYNAFWPRGIDNRPDLEDVQGEYYDLINSLLVGETSSVESTGAIATAMCTVFLASSPVLLY